MLLLVESAEHINWTFTLEFAREILVLDLLIEEVAVAVRVPGHEPRYSRTPRHAPRIFAVVPFDLLQAPERGGAGFGRLVLGKPRLTRARTVSWREAILWRLVEVEALAEH